LTGFSPTTVAVYEDLWYTESLAVDDVVELTPSKPVVMWVTLREGHFNTRAHGKR